MRYRSTTVRITRRCVDSALAIDLVNRFSDLNEIFINKPIDDIERFLNFLKSSGNIVALQFSQCQPQELFDRLPDYCSEAVHLL